MKILYFASIREVLGTGEEIYAPESPVSTVQELIDRLCGRGELWKRTLQQDNLLVSVNQQMADTLTKVDDQDEIAFFPPVTGG